MIKFMICFTTALAIIILGLIILRDSAQRGYIGEIPEVLVTAPRYQETDMDSLGMMPEIVVTAKSHSPRSASSQHEQYETGREKYMSMLRDTAKIGLYVLVVLTIITWGFIAFGHTFVYHHEPHTHKHNFSRKLHQYYLHRKKQVDNMLKISAH